MNQYISAQQQYDAAVAAQRREDVLFSHRVKVAVQANSQYYNLNKPLSQYNDYNKVEANAQGIIYHLNQAINAPESKANLSIKELAALYEIKDPTVLAKFITDNVKFTTVTEKFTTVTEKAAVLPTPPANLQFKDILLGTVLLGASAANKVYTEFKNIPLVKETLFNPNLLQLPLAGLPYGYQSSVSVQEAKAVTETGLAKAQDNVSNVIGKVSLGVLSKAVTFLPETPVGVAAFTAFPTIGRTILEIASAVGTAIGIAQVASFTETKDLNQLESGILNVALGAGGKLFSYLKEPVILKQDALTSETAAKENIAILIRDEQNLNLGQYTIAKYYPERFAFVTSRFDLLLEKFSPVKGYFSKLADEELSFSELQLKYPSGEKVSISEPKVIAGGTDVLITKEGRIVAGVGPAGVKVPEIIVESGTPGRSEPILKAVLTGEMGAQSDLRNIDLENLDSATRSVLKELLNLPKTGGITEITIQNQMINDENLITKLEIASKEPKFLVSDVAERPITISKGEVQISGYAKVRGRPVLNVREFPLETDLINEEKVFSKVIEERLGREKIVDKVLRGDITSVQKSLSSVEYQKDFGLVEEEQLIGRTGVKTLKINKIVTHDLSAQEFLDLTPGEVVARTRQGGKVFKATTSRPEKISVSTTVKTYNLPPQKEFFGERLVKPERPSKPFTDEASSEVQKLESQFNKAQQKQIKENVLRTGKEIIAKADLLVRTVPAPRLKPIVGPSTALSAALSLASAASPKELNLARTEDKAINKEMSREVAKEVSREITKEVSKEVTKEISRTIPREITREITKSLLKQVPKEQTREIYGFSTVTSLPSEPHKSLFLTKGSPRRKQMKTKRKKGRGNPLYYEPDLTSLTFNITEKVRKKDLAKFIRNPPELRALIKVVK